MDKKCLIGNLYKFPSLEGKEFYDNISKYIEIALKKNDIDSSIFNLRFNEDLSEADLRYWKERIRTEFLKKYTDLELLSKIIDVRRKNDLFTAGIFGATGCFTNSPFLFFFGTLSFLSFLESNEKKRLTDNRKNLLNIGKRMEVLPIYDPALEEIERKFDTYDGRERDIYQLMLLSLKINEARDFYKGKLESKLSLKKFVREAVRRMSKNIAESEKIASYNILNLVNIRQNKRGIIIFALPFKNSYELYTNFTPDMIYLSDEFDLEYCIIAPESFYPYLTDVKEKIDRYIKETVVRSEIANTLLKKALHKKTKMRDIMSVLFGLGFTGYGLFAKNPLFLSFGAYPLIQILPSKLIDRKSLEFYEEMLDKADRFIEKKKDVRYYRNDELSQIDDTIRKTGNYSDAYHLMNQINRDEYKWIKEIYRKRAIDEINKGKDSTAIMVVKR